MSSNDKLIAYFEELKKRHRELDTLIEAKNHNYNVTDEVRILKTQKLWLKDEMHRIQARIKGPTVDGL
jgi:uncharacterized protein YdcH (DUF465 family)